MKKLVGFFLTLFVTSASAQNFSANDVSILLRPPSSETDVRIPVPDAIFTQGLAEKAAAVVELINTTPNKVATIDSSVLSTRRDLLHVSSIRVDPGAPGGHESFVPFGRNLQIRLVAQPVDFAESAPIKDEAVHLVYTFGKADTDEGRAKSQCPFRVLPNDQDIADFQAAIDDLAALKAELSDMGVSTDGAPLGIHPAFAADAASEHLGNRLAAFLTTHLSEARLSAVSVAGLPPDAPEPWIFLALQRTETGFDPVPGPALAQPDDPDAMKNFQQMLSFVPSQNPDGAVVPAGLSRNKIPVDCFANFVLPELGLPQPGTDEGVSTSPLFGTIPIDPIAAADTAAIIADPTNSHFFNTDCISCHTETRRQIEAGPDHDAVRNQIADAESIDPEALRGSPAGMPNDFDHWNVRAFGWFPGFPATSGEARATATRRTARETAEVIECLNHGDWTRIDGPCVDVVPEATLLGQGWSDDIQRSFYHTSQGGAIMPLTWFKALETASGGERFASDTNLARYGFLPSPKDAANPHGLPVGFAIMGDGSNASVGLNCAACHTGNVIIGGETLRVEGAPASLDFDLFVNDLARAVNETAQLDFTNPEGPAPDARLRRFIASVGIQNRDEVSDPKAFVDQFIAFSTKFSGRMAQRNPLYPSGPGRVDALTQIVNSLAVKDLGIETNLATPSAPTSYPPLWLSNELEFVQWNLSVADPLSRNIGQALGVFGQATLAGEDAFNSTADRAALELFESWIGSLRPPPWQSALAGEIDDTLGAQGRDLFAANCDGCHNAPPFRRSLEADSLNGDQFIKVTAIRARDVGTDGEYTRAFTQRWVNTGDLSDKLGLGQNAPAFQYLGRVVGAVTRKLVGDEASTAMRLRPVGHADCGASTGPCGYLPPLLGEGLKASPLIGLWATGPYLHNGSVRTVYQVISPPEERERTFFIGSRSYDPDQMGFLSEDAEGAFLFDTSVPGNGNQGHVFWPKPFTHEEKLAIIEYLKDPFQFPIDR